MTFHDSSAGNKSIQCFRYSYVTIKYNMTYRISIILEPECMNRALWFRLCSESVGTAEVAIVFPNVLMVNINRYKARSERYMRQFRVNADIGDAI